MDERLDGEGVGTGCCLASFLACCCGSLAGEDAFVDISIFMSESGAALVRMVVVAAE